MEYIEFIETIKIIDWYRTIPIVLFFLIFARLFFIFSFIVIQRDIQGKYDWNEQINPEKIKTCVVLFLIAVFFILISDKSFLVNKTSFDLWSNFFITTAGLIGVYTYMEMTIRTPSIKYLKLDYLFYNDEKIEKTILLENNDVYHNSELVEKEKVDFNSLQILNLDLLKDQAIFRKEAYRTVYLKIGGKKKMKDRLYLISALDKELGGQFAEIDIDDLKRIKEVVLFINKFFVFKCENYPNENDYNQKNFKDWLKIKK